MLVKSVYLDQYCKGMLVCCSNAGTLMHEKQMTEEGHEVTFATHLLNGAYLLTTLAMPYLRRAQDARVVMVSSGGMYATPFPSWEEATSTRGKYDGTMAYAYAKRGQVCIKLWLQILFWCALRSHWLICYWSWEFCEIALQYFVLPIQTCLHKRSCMACFCSRNFLGGLRGPFSQIIDFHFCVCRVVGIAVWALCSDVSRCEICFMSSGMDKHSRSQRKVGVH